MAEKRKALGRGLGSLIPTQESDVSRETSLTPEKAMDVFFPRSGETTGASRAGHSAVTADLLKPPARRTQKTKAKSAPKATPVIPASTQSTSHRTADNVPPAVGDLVVPEAASGEELELLPVPGARMAVLKIAEIAANLDQPREYFEEEALQELADSIKEIGVLQPIVVREISDKSKRYEALSQAQIRAGKPAELKYELIMGERRLRASQLAGLAEIPAIIRDTQDDEMLRDALLENLHRVQLNAIEEAAAYQQLLNEFGCTQEELSQRIKRSRPQISNTIRLLKLPHSVQLKVMANVLSMGHARALLGLDSVEKMEHLAERIVAEGLSVRTTEELVSLGDVRLAKKAVVAKKAAAPLSIEATFVQDRLADLFDTKVTVEQRKRKGKIIVEFAGAEDLERIAALVQVLKLSGERP